MTETLERLLDAAEDALRLRGYHAVSFRDLADALQIKSASVHYYFRHKEDLGLAVVARYRERFFAALEAEVALEEKAASKAKRLSGPAARLKAFCRVYRQALTGSDRICLCGMLGAESGGLPEKLSKAVADFFQENIDWVAENLPEGLSPSERGRKARHMVTTLQGAMMLAHSLDQMAVFDDAVEELLAAVGG